MFDLAENTNELTHSLHHQKKKKNHSELKKTTKNLAGPKPHGIAIHFQIVFKSAQLSLRVWKDAYISSSMTPC